jgi:hypothetical protein
MADSYYLDGRIEPTKHVKMLIYPRERQFYDAHAETCGCDLKYEPCRFMFEYLGKRTHYMPDFHCPTSNIFFEVVGSRQAYYANKDKLDTFRTAFPLVNLMLVHPNGCEVFIRKQNRVGIIKGSCQMEQEAYQCMTVDLIHGQK